ncbi:MAG: DUF4396 domain-containing protein [Terriglobales bacterium]
MANYPEWLHVLAWLYLGVSFLCALIITVHELSRPQKMMVMNFVWPITALYFGLVGLWGYFHSGFKFTSQHQEEMQREIETELRREQTTGFREMPRDSGKTGPTREQIAIAASHCGAGCTLGDIVGEWWIFGLGLVIAGGELGTRLLLDFLLAWAFGVAFQYFTIVPMRGLSFGKGLVAAIRADILSIVAFQAGMSIWAVLTYFVFFPNPHLKVNEAVFWFMMQVGMIIGFGTSYGVNSFLIEKGWKERMPQYKHEKDARTQDSTTTSRVASLKTEERPGSHRISRIARQLHIS